MIDKVGLNLSALSNIEAPEISINQTANAILTELPINATEMTGGFFPYIILGGMFIITYWMLSDKTQQGDFGYSDLRAMTLSFGIVSSVALVQITTGLIQSWMAVVFFLLAFMMSNVVLIMVENKQ